jgi:D-alanine-D-alanine ligase
MRIGFTFDLKAEYLGAGYDEEQTAELERDDTVAAIEQTLASLGHEVDRIGHGRALAARLGAGARWDLVFNIAEGIAGAARESQVPALLDLFAIPYTFSDPLVLAVCLDKRLAKQVVAARGVPTPAFVLVEGPEDLAAAQALPPPLFAKPVAEGTSRGVGAASRIDRPDQLPEVCAALLARYAQPVLVERYLPGRELTVGVVGTGAAARPLGALEVEIVGPQADSGVYSYDNKRLFEDRVRYRVADDPAAHEAVALALCAYRALGCRDAGRVDVRCDEHGRPCFIECNPLAGLNPEISDIAILARLVGLGYRALIAEVLSSAAARLPKAA